MEGVDDVFNDVIWEGVLCEFEGVVFGYSIFVPLV